MIPVWLSAVILRCLVKGWYGRITIDVDDGIVISVIPAQNIRKPKKEEQYP